MIYLKETFAMSKASKFFFGVTTSTAVAIIVTIHVRQHLERSNLREGVLKDLERRKMRQTQNIDILHQQAELTKQLKKELEKESNTNTSRI